MLAITIDCRFAHYVCRIETPREPRTPWTEPEGTNGFPTGVCAIGASAGGLEPLETFFGSMPVDTGLAFVVIQHLSPDHPSMMDSLLQRHTTMIVRQATDGVLLQPNHVYLIPPDRVLTVEGAELRLSERDRSDASPPSPHPIDVFFVSLAEQWATNGAAIVLSGTGNDGAEGTERVRRAGGLTLAQDESASFHGMPGAADARGYVDAVGSVPMIAKFVVDFFNDGIRPTPTLIDARFTATEEAIIADMASSTGVDFRSYKRGTVRRRIEHRMTITGDTTLVQLADRVRSSVDERNALTDDILIGVTSFFRDPEVFTELGATAIEQLLTAAHSESRAVRTWVVGCATGQEVYTMAILLAEARAHLDLDVPIQIFATDVHEGALASAAEGVFTDDDVQSVPQSLRSRYFRRHAENWRVRDEVRAMITFARHNVLTDTPFTRIDLVSCRNTLIYFNQTAQQRALWALGFALRHEGILLLGSSESPGFLSPDFSPISASHRIFVKTGDAAIKSFRRRMGPERLATAAAGLSVTRAVSGPDQSLLRAYDKLLDDHFVGGLIIDARNEVVHVIGQARQWLSVATGRPSLDIHSLVVDPTLRLAIGSIVRAVNTPDSGVTQRLVSVRLSDDVDSQILLQGRQLISGGNQFTLVSGQPVNEQEVVISADLVTAIDPGDIDRIGQIERELAYTRESLQSALEEQETSNEELNAANEELIASNEELQSSNEELSALNEELRTLNDEHHRRLQEVLELTADLEQILASTEIGIVLLDGDQTIRRFSDPARDYFHLMATDQGRPFEHIRARFTSLDFEEAVVSALVSGRSSTLRAELEHNGDTVLVRVRPYPLPREDTGVAITVVALGSAATSDQERVLIDFLEASPVNFAVFDADRVGVLTNTDVPLVGRRFDDFAVEQGSDLAAVQDLFQRAASNGPATGILPFGASDFLAIVWSFESGAADHYGWISGPVHSLRDSLGQWVEGQTVGVVAELLGVGAAVIAPDGAILERFSAGAADPDAPAALEHNENILAMSDLVASCVELGFDRVDQHVEMFIDNETRPAHVRALRLGSDAGSPFLVVAMTIPSMTADS